MLGEPATIAKWVLLPAIPKILGDLDGPSLLLIPWPVPSFSRLQHVRFDGAKTGFFTRKDHVIDENASLLEIILPVSELHI